MLKIKTLPKEVIVRMNRFLRTYGLEVTGSSFVADSGTLNLGLNQDDVPQSAAVDLAVFCQQELDLEVHKVVVNSRQVVDIA